MRFVSLQTLPVIMGTQAQENLKVEAAVGGKPLVRSRAYQDKVRQAHCTFLPLAGWPRPLSFADALFTAPHGTVGSVYSGARGPSGKLTNLGGTYLPVLLEVHPLLTSAFAFVRIAYFLLCRPW